MLVTIIICTIRRVELIRGLLDSLAAQTWSEFEILLVGAEDSRRQVDCFGQLKFLPAPRGLAAARNVGLRNATGDLICFLDDDVLLPPTFLADAVAMFDRRELSDMGGLTGYDTVNYPQPMCNRWRLRRLLGVVSNLRPGAVDHLGRNVPLSFFQPFSGFQDVGWLPGFCQIYRRAALEGIFCDEGVIGGDDRDLSMQVGKGWRLVLAGHLKLQHLQDMQSRFAPLPQLWRVAYGMGRSLDKGRRSLADSWLIGWYLVAELLIDLLAWVRRPSMLNLRIAIVRQRGYVAGLASAGSVEMRGLAGRCPSTE